MKGMLTVLIPICLFVSSVDLHAQQDRYIGVSANLQNTWMRFQNNYELFDCPQIADAIVDYDITIGFAGGLSMGFQTGKGQAIQLEVLYSQMGQDYADSYRPGVGCPNPYEVVRKVDISYLQFPVMYKLHTTQKKLRYFVMGGLQIGFKLSTKELITVVDETKGPNDLRVGEDAKYSQIDFGVRVGAGIDYMVGQDFMLSLSGQAFSSIHDITASDVKEIPWFAQYNVAYHKSYNFSWGLNASFYYYIRGRRFPAAF